MNARFDWADGLKQAENSVLSGLCAARSGAGEFPTQRREVAKIAKGIRDQEIDVVDALRGEARPTSGR
jgi:hypothetical protein